MCPRHFAHALSILHITIHYIFQLFFCIHPRKQFGRVSGIGSVCVYVSTARQAFVCIDGEKRSVCLEVLLCFVLSRWDFELHPLMCVRVCVCGCCLSSTQTATDGKWGPRGFRQRNFPRACSSVFRGAKFYKSLLISLPLSPPPLSPPPLSPPPLSLYLSARRFVQCVRVCAVLSILHSLTWHAYSTATVRYGVDCRSPL